MNELAKPEASASASGSEASARTSIPKHSLRLVLQLEDTPHNRATLMSVWGYIRAVAHPIEGSMAVLKREEITLIDCLGKTTMPLNVKLTDAGPETPDLS